jgi:hypothetical protein
MKPGPKSALDDDNLMLWEHEWYWVFSLLVSGKPGRTDVQRYAEPPPPPKRENVPESLYQERIEDQNRRMLIPAEWTERARPFEIQDIPPERDVWEKLESARTPEDVRMAYRESRVWLNPQKTGKPFVADLEIHAAEFLEGKNYRYPSSDRPSSEKKRILHCARVMAGITVGISGATAIHLLRTLEHDAKCECVPCFIKREEDLAKIISDHFAKMSGTTPSS